MSVNDSTKKNDRGDEKMRPDAGGGQTRPYVQVPVATRTHVTRGRFLGKVIVDNGGKWITYSSIKSITMTHSTNFLVHSSCIWFLSIKIAF
jgi:hypothetical protein